MRKQRKTYGAEVKARITLEELSASAFHDHLNEPAIADAPLDRLL